MVAYGGLGQTLVQQVEQERREHLNDLLAHDDGCGLDVPRPRPIVQARPGQAWALALRVLRLKNGRALSAATGVAHVVCPLAECLSPLCRLRLRRCAAGRSHPHHPSRRAPTPRLQAALFMCGRGAHAPGYDVLAARRFEFIPIWGYAVMLLYAMRRVRASCRGRRRRLSFGTTWGPVCHAVEYVVQWGLEHRELGCLARHRRRRDPHRAEPQRSTRCAPAEAPRMVREGYEPVLKKKRWCLLNRHHRGAEQPKSL